MKTRFLVLSSLAALCAPATAYAAEAALDDADYGPDIVVIGADSGYDFDTTGSGTKTTTPILDVPQAISVVSARQIADQQIRSIADLVRMVPGVSAGQGEGNRDQITLRGNNSTADFFVDGLRDDVQYYRSFYNIDRVEVFKGANAMIFGRGGGGGLVNRVTKSAHPGQTAIEASASVDSFGSAYGAVDANGGSQTVGVRLNAFVERLANHRDAFDGTRYGINPTIHADFGDAAHVDLAYEYVRDDRVSDRGIPSAFAGSIANPAGPLTGARDRFFGLAGFNDSDVTAHIVRARGRFDLSDAVTLTAQGLYADYDKIYVNVFAATAVGGTTAAPTVGVEAYADPTRRKNAIGQINLEWRGDTGGIGHVVLIGGEVTAQDTANERINGYFGAALTAANRRRVIALTDPLVIPAFTLVAGPAGNSNRRVKATVDQISGYVQDQIALGSAVDLIVGIRYDRLENDVTNRFTGAVATRVDDLWSPRAGLVVKPAPNASLYVSYARSYLPQSGDQFLTFDASAATLEPEKFDNYEIGAKWDIRPGLSFTTAVYRLDRSNTRAPGPTPGTTVQTGSQRSSGVELSLAGQLTSRWNISAGYARTRAVVSETTSAAPAGRRVAQVPRHQLSLWNRYDVTDEFGIGLGVLHQSASFASISNATRLPGYTRVDAALFVKLDERFSAQLNVENLTNTRYFPVAHNDNNISPGAPINARFTLTARY